MKIRAAIFDVYGTLMEVGPAPADAEAQWQKLCEEFLGRLPMSRHDFAQKAGLIIARQHAQARQYGIPWPEIQWPSIVSEVLSSVAALPKDRQEDFIFRQMQLGRTVRLGAHVAETLRRLQARGCALGIASNAQAYTLRELDAALQTGGLALSAFDPELSLWSFANGFSKPDPHVFRILSARLETRGIAPSEILMVGDRSDNDIEPARAQQWQTWQVTKTPMAQAQHSGTFAQLLAALGKGPSFTILF